MLRQVPPRVLLDSIHAVFKPSCEALIAQTYPAGPPPLTVTSIFLTFNYLKTTFQVLLNYLLIPLRKDTASLPSIIL